MLTAVWLYKQTDACVIIFLIYKNVLYNFLPAEQKFYRVNIMSNVIMMCGVCGSGKKTYAKQKEKEGYIRLSIDEEMWNTYGQRGIDYPENQYDILSEEIELVLRKRMEQLIKNGKNVVIDFSFWNKENRELYRNIIKNAGGTVKLVYMKASKEVLRKRLQKRNLSLNANSPFIITDATMMIRFMFN